MGRVVVGWALGLGLGTTLWFALSPFLSDQQEQLVGWLLMGSYALVLAVVQVRARRKAPRGSSS